MRETRVGSVSTAPGELRFSVEIAAATREIWFEVDPPIVPSADALVAGALLPAMAQGEPLRVPIAIDRRLRRGLGEIQAILVSWRDEFPYLTGKPRRIDLLCERPVSKRRAGVGDGIAAFFSGGVDSLATALSNPEITHLIHVGGFDIGLDQAELDREIRARLLDSATQMGKTLISVRTNLRELLDEFVPWGAAFGSAIASVALLLEPTIRRAYVSSDFTYETLEPRGTHPMLDHLWSTEGLEIVHYGAHLSRSSKVSLIADSEVARRVLRVCWQGTADGYNCGRCEKCLRTMVALEALEVREHFETFPDGLDLGAVAALEPTTSLELGYWRDNLALAQRLGADEELVAAIEAAAANADSLLA